MSQRDGQTYRYPTVRSQSIHRVIAEEVLGRPLPQGVEIHHVNEDDQDYRHCNLVICQDKKYHKMLHTRLRALRACGNPEWRKCTICKEYAPVEQLQVYVASRTGYERAPTHPVCSAALTLARKKRKKGMLP